MARPVLRKAQKKKSNNAQAVKAFEKEVIPFCSKIFVHLLRDTCKILPRYKSSDYQRDVSTIERRIQSDGLRFAAHELPDLFDNVLNYLEGRLYSFPNFKLSKGKQYPALFSGMLQYVFDSNDKKDECVSKALKCLYQVCTVFSKIEGPYSDSVLLAGVEKFIAGDTVLGTLSWASTPAPPILDGYTYAEVMDDARDFITELFLDFDPAEVFKPQPGSGSTNSPTDLGERFRPQVLYTQVHDVFDYDYTYQTVYQYIFGESITLGLPTKEYPTSRYKQIPKKFGKPRGICLEESEVQFAQQGLRRPIYAFIEQEHSEVRGRINFTDQTINQSLALSSSLTLAYATLDMRGASDNVGRENVLSMFRDSPLFEGLDALSTRYITLPDYAPVKILLSNVFAPMGSGVCFPIMSLYHYALMRAILRCSRVPSDRDAAKDLYVYGDDLIVPSSCVYTLYQCMPTFGCVFNTEKSFVHSHFRESCGVHAYAGLDITPTFIKHVITNSTKQTDSTCLLSLIAKEHSLRIKGFVSAATYIRTRCTEIWGTLPWVSYSSPILGWKVIDVVGFVHPATLYTKCRKAKLKDEWIQPNRRALVNHDPIPIKVPKPAVDTSLYEYRVRIIKPRKDPNVVLNDQEGYLRKLLTDAYDASDVPGEFRDLTIAWTWVSEPALSINDR